MILVDTNAVSELMRPEPNATVFAWADAQPRAGICTSAIVEAVILSGIAALPGGRRRAQLTLEAQRLFTEDFGGRVLPFDREAAARYAELTKRRRAAGRPVHGFDGSSLRRRLRSERRSQHATSATSRDAGSRPSTLGAGGRDRPRPQAGRSLELHPRLRLHPRADVTRSAASISSSFALRPVTTT